MAPEKITTQTLTTGHFALTINDAFADPNLITQLADMQLLIIDAKKISHGKDYVVEKTLEIFGVNQRVAIKVFTAQSRIKDWYDKKIRSKAERSYRAAEQFINADIVTPAPIACLDYWQANRLIESYYICLFEPATCFRDALFEIFNHTKDSAELMVLLELVAPEIKRLHDAGFMHGDLGNQNILLPKNPDGSWARPSFIDLNRYQYFAEGLTDKARAKDLARPILPGNYLHFFLQIYAGNNELPKNLSKEHQQERARFTRHRNSRNLRHPIRYFKNRGKRYTSGYPDNKNYWLWDEKTAQPMIALSKKEKNRERSLKDTLITVRRVLTRLPAIWREYRKLKPLDFSQKISMRNTIGVSLNPKSSYQAQELSLLQELGNPPVFVRFYRHESKSQWIETIDLIHRLHGDGVAISVGLLQDRDAVLTLSLWEDFLEAIVPAIVDLVDEIEITHAFNRAKWGIWRLAEWRQLTEAALKYQERYTTIKMTGPACIDFEYAPVISALCEMERLNKAPRFSAISHLLYVDRRGAPENRQGKFSTLDKVRLLRAIARTSSATDDRVVISEVNWPIENTDVWSPIVCPYVTARWQKRPSGESETNYAYYLLRYLAITICSGHVDQVFWWQLSAKGYGLVDDQNEFKRRPAFHALRFFLSFIKDASFERRHRTEESNDNNEVYYLEFSKENVRFMMAWSTAEIPQPITMSIAHAWNYLGEPVTSPQLSNAPIYFQMP